MRTSEQIDQIAAALAKAQGEMSHANFDAVNPAFKSKYATLASIIDAIRLPLSHNGIAWIQSVVKTADGLYAVTRMVHASGQWIECDGPEVPIDKRNAHGAGSSTTYAKRFGLAAAVGIAADTDDDGNSAGNGRPVTISEEAQSWLAEIAKADGLQSLSEVGEKLAKLNLPVAEKGLLREAFGKRREALSRAKS